MSKHDNRGIIKSRRAYARHGEIAPQKLSSAIWGIFFKGVAVFLGAVLAIGGITFLNLTKTLSDNTLQLTDANGNAIKPADLKGAINVLLVVQP